MNWYKHDTNATQDAKIRKVIMSHGPTGYAVYFHCLELIAGSVCDERATFELEHDAEIIADNLKVQGTGDKSGREIVENIMRDMVNLGLFEESNGHIFCMKMLKRLDSSMTSNPRLRTLIKKAHDHHDGIMISHARTEKKRTEEKRREKNKEIASQAPPAPKKQAKESHPDYVRTVELFATTYERLHKEKMSFSGKDGKHINSLLSNHSYSDIEKKIAIFISKRDSDAWLKQQALTPGLILSQWNKLIAAPAGRNLPSFSEYGEKYL